MKIDIINSFQFRIKKGRRDRKDRLIILFFFLIGTLLSILIQYIRTQTAQTYLLVFSGVVALVIIFYLVTEISVIFNIEDNSCSYLKKFFFIPLARNRWQISNISKIVSVERRNSNAQDRNPKANFKSYFVASVELRGFREGSQPPSTMQIFYQKTYSLTQHTRNIKENNQIVKGVSEYFQKLGLPIDYEFIRELK